MATLLNASLPSDDEEDQDYVPDEVDEEERRAAKAAKKPKRLRGAAAGANVEAEPQAQAPADELEDEDEALPASKREAKKAKVDALWSMLNRKPPAAAAAQPSSCGGGSLASLCKPARSKGKGGADEVGDEGWDGFAMFCKLPSAASPASLPRERSRAAPPVYPPLAACTSCVACARDAHACLDHPAAQAWMRQLGLGSKPKTAVGGTASAATDKTSVAAAALAAAKAATSAAGAARMGGTITVQEQRRFAGQTITVNKEVAAGSKEAQKAAAEAEAAARKKAGLDAVLASLEQAKKVGVGQGDGAPLPAAARDLGRMPVCTAPEAGNGHCPCAWLENTEDCRTAARRIRQSKRCLSCLVSGSFGASTSLPPPP